MTFQVHETLVYRGDKRKIRAFPLESCQRQVPYLRDNSTNCWRGYVGTWDVLDDVLRLVQLAAPHGQGTSNGLDVMFPDHEGSVEAPWFSGAINPDDIVNPEDDYWVEFCKLNNRHFLWFTLVVHKGKLLLEESIHLQSRVIQSRLTMHAASIIPEQELGFLQAIHPDVENPGPKLVYADWLEKQQDPRNLLLRTEVERLSKEGSKRTTSAERGCRRPIPPMWEYAIGGYHDPEDTLWYWRWLAGIPEVTPEVAWIRNIMGCWKGRAE